MVEVVVEPGAALLAEGALPNLMVVRLVKDLFLHAVGHIGVSAVDGQGGGQSVIGVDHQGHVGRQLDALLEQVHGDVQLAVAIQLIAKQVGQHHGVRLEEFQHPSGGRLVHLQTGVFRIEFPHPVGRQRQGGGHAGEHIGAGVVAHHRVSLPFQGGAEEIVGGGLAVGAADHEGVLVDAANEVADDGRINLQRHTAREGLPMGTLQFAGQPSSLGRPDGKDGS